MSASTVAAPPTGANDPAVTRNDRVSASPSPPTSPTHPTAAPPCEPKPRPSKLGISYNIPAGLSSWKAPPPRGTSRHHPQQNQIITAGTDGSLHLHDLAGRHLRHLDPKLPAAATALATSSDGNLLLAAAQDGSILLLTLTEAKPIARFKDHQAPISAAAISPDGKNLATASLDGSATLRSTQPDSQPITLRGHGARFDKLHFSPDSSLLLTSGPGAPPAIWNVKDGSHLLNLRIERKASSPPDSPPTAKLSPPPFARDASSKVNAAPASHTASSPSRQRTHGPPLLARRATHTR